MRTSLILPEMVACFQGNLLEADPARISDTLLGQTFFIFWFTDPPTLFSANQNKNEILLSGFFFIATD